jgi:hypothetical protein
MKPYRIVEETDTHVTYEYRTAYTWTLYAIASFSNPLRIRVPK